MRPPGKIQVLARSAGRGAKPAQCPPKVLAHQNGPAGRNEDFAGGVVLALVELARFDQRVDDPEVVRPHAHR